MEDQPEARFVFDIPLRKCYTAQQVLTLWPNVTELELYRLVMNGRLRAYLVNKDRQFPNGDNSVEFLSADEGAPHLIEQDGEQSLCWDYVRFSVVAIVMFEREFGIESLRPYSDFSEVESKYAKHLEWLCKSRITLINESSLCASYPLCNFYNEDGVNDMLSLFTKFEPVVDEFSINVDNSTFSVPQFELDEWKYQFDRHNLRTWNMIETYTEIDSSGTETDIDAVIKVQKRLFQGKAPSAIVNDMTREGYSKEVIAYVLQNALVKAVTLSRIGELLHEKKSLSQQAQMKYANKLLSIAKEMPIQIAE